MEKDKTIPTLSQTDVITRAYDEDFCIVDCDHYEYEIGLEDNDEICHLGIGIKNCSHCFKNRALYE